MAKKFAADKILILKLRKLGDVLNITPAVRQLRELYPNAEITIISEPLGAQVFEFSHNVDRIWVLKRNPTYVDYLKLCYKVYKQHFDIVIDFYHHNKTALITNLSRATHRLGYAYAEEKKALSYNKTVHLTTDDRTKRYSVLHHLKLTKMLGTNSNDFEIEFPVSESVISFGKNFANNHDFTNKTIAFCCQSERATAQVSQDLFVQIGNYLTDRGYFIYFIYGPGEKDMATIVYENMSKTSSCLIDYEVPTIAQVRSILENCLMYIGNDGGNKHLAITAGIPTLSLFIGDCPEVWTPPQPAKHRFIQTKNNLTCFQDFEKIFESWSTTENKFIDV
jgi:ADP-heptose:LPS heptosyltransferase